MSYPSGGVKNWCQITNISIFIKKPSKVLPEVYIKKIAPTFCKLRLLKYSLKRAFLTPTQ